MLEVVGPEVATTGREGLPDSPVNLIRHTISELGEQGAPDGRLVSFGLFGPIGLALLGVGALALLNEGAVTFPAGFGLLAVALGVGYVGGALFPCDRGSPLTGSGRQQLHNLAGGVQYVGGAVALFLAADEPRLLPPFLVPWLLGSAGVVAVVALALSVQVLFPVRGLIQRVGELLLFGNLLLLTWPYQ
ncbi:MAG TPA: DUF998 domain-containing protein [Chloroflexaceae bacterium]|nr:DUF998 domain-containing protein [Chloroflexaceae bacterium]